MLSNLHVMVRSQTPFHGNYCNVLQGNLIYVDMHSNLWLRTSRFAVVVWIEIVFIGPGKPAREGQLNACPSKNNKRRTQGLGTCILMFFVKHMDSKHFQTFSRLTYCCFCWLFLIGEIWEIWRDSGLSNSHGFRLWKDLCPDGPVDRPSTWENLAAHGSQVQSPIAQLWKEIPLLDYWVLLW